MKPISNRYELKQLLSPLLDGQLYEGKDLSLARSVFIYTVDLQGEATAKQYIGKLGSAAQQGATDSPFLHVLDIEAGSGNIHVIISYKPGCSFRQFVRNNPPSFKEAVAMIANLGQALLDAAEERHLNFSLDPCNIWITDDGTIHVINTWDRPSTDSRLSKGLSRLFVQLMARTDHVPEDAESLSSALYRALVLPVNKKEEVVAAVTEAWKEKLSLASFVQYMNMLLQSPPSAAFRDERIDAPISRTKTLTYQEMQVAYHEEEQTRRPVYRNRWLKMGKKVWIALSLSVLGLAVFAGGFVLLVETMSGGGKSKPAEPAVVEHRPQPAVPQKTVAEAPKEKPPVVAPSGDQPIVGVPTLTGLSKEAAEKMALDTGLRYEFFLEIDKQAAGTVFKQEPRPNEQVEKGSKVIFWISKGPSPQ